VILVAVGTFRHGFDALVAAADEAAGALGVPGFAQIGHSAVVPRHLAWARFLAPAELARRIEAAEAVVCHGGIGLIGEAMRAGKPILVLPRRGRPTRASPAGDQSELARRLAERHPIRVGERPEELRAGLAALLASPGPRRYALGSDVPAILTRFLAGDEGQSCPTRSS
jgi:UDP:flavonoid glycosyltransferase YjiC (YdhE family)